jgi:hypothetical protein
MSIFADKDMSKAEKKKKILHALKMLDDGDGGKGGEDDVLDDDGEGDKMDAKPGRKAKAGEVDLLEQINAERAKTKAILSATKDLPAGSVSDVFLEQLQAAKGESEIKALVADRKALLESAGSTKGGKLGVVGKTPVSSPAGAGGTTLDFATFAKQLKKGVR